MKGAHFSKDEDIFFADVADDEMVVDADTVLYQVGILPPDSEACMAWLINTSVDLAEALLARLDKRLPKRDILQYLECRRITHDLRPAAKAFRRQDFKTNEAMEAELLKVSNSLFESYEGETAFELPFALEGLYEEILVIATGGKGVVSDDLIGWMDGEIDGLAVADADKDEYRQLFRDLSAFVCLGELSEDDWEELMSDDSDTL